MKKTVRDIAVSGRRLLVRADFNVPLDKKTGLVLDDTRITAVVPLLNYLLERKAKVILCSHLGRPKGQPDPLLSMKPIAKRLSEALSRPVQVASCCIHPDVQQSALSLEGGEILLLENLRFHLEEEQNDQHYAKSLSSLAEIYVNDAFGVAHRAHASTIGVTAHLPSVAGLLMEKELEFLGKVATRPERPYAAVVGGAKISTKIGVLENLLPIVDKILIGGGVANTFLAAEGFNVAESLVDTDYLESAKLIMERASTTGTKLLLPTDVIATDDFRADAHAKRVSVKEVPQGWHIMDIGETTVNVFGKALETCKTIVWNGPMGVIEFNSFAHGSHRLAHTIASLKQATTILGGGETGLIARQLGLEKEFSHISTGGGACLEFLSGKELPGVVSLLER